MVLHDHYGVLGVPRDATTRRIKEAYKEAVRELRPDRSQKQAGELMHALKLARDTLTDDLARKQYDASLEDNAVLAWMDSLPTTALDDDLYNDPEETVSMEGAAQVRDVTNSWGKFGYNLRQGQAFSPTGGEEVALDLDDLVY
jgi:curved DNA-binding protein CbpA